MGVLLLLLLLDTSVSELSVALPRRFRSEGRPRLFVVTSRIFLRQTEDGVANLVMLGAIVQNRGAY